MNALRKKFQSLPTPNHKPHQQHTTLPLELNTSTHTQADSL